MVARALACQHGPRRDERNQEAAGCWTDTTTGSSASARSGRRSSPAFARASTTRRGSCSPRRNAARVRRPRRAVPVGVGRARQPVAGQPLRGGRAVLPAQGQPPILGGLAFRPDQPIISVMAGVPARRAGIPGRACQRHRPGHPAAAGRPSCRDHAGSSRGPRPRVPCSAGWAGRPTSRMPARSRPCPPRPAPSRRTCGTWPTISQLAERPGRRARAGRAVRAIHLRQRGRGPRQQPRRTSTSSPGRTRLPAASTSGSARCSTRRASSIPSAGHSRSSTTSFRSAGLTFRGGDPVESHLRDL